MTMELRIRSLPLEGSKKLARKLKNRAPDLVCSACRTRDFALVEAPDDGVRTTLLREWRNEFDDLLGSARQPHVTVICTNCGNVHQFAEAVVNGSIEADAYGKDYTNE